MQFLPAGCSVHVNADPGNGDPVIVLGFPLTQEAADAESPEQDEVLYVGLDEAAARACDALLLDGIVRAATLREMLTMFPELREQITQTVIFRWTEPGWSDGTT